MKLYILHMGESLPPTIRAEWESLVDASRLRRVRACKHAANAEQSLCGEILARYALGRELHRAPSALALGRRPSGKPELVSPAGPHFSVSHAGRLAVCAVADSPVGADVEGKTVKESLTPWFCHPNELILQASDPDPARLRLRLWTLKESWVKCLETGVGRHMADLDLAEAVRGAEDCDIAFTRSGCAFRSLFVGPAAVAVCVRES